MARTFAACSPLGPWLVSNSTFCPSSRLRYPVPEIALEMHEYVGAATVLSDEAEALLTVKPLHGTSCH